jgi:hypothetical protein
MDLPNPPAPPAINFFSIATDTDPAEGEVKEEVK